ncbi:MAG: ImcF-related family protein [Gemmatimonas sp.]
MISPPVATQKPATRWIIAGAVLLFFVLLMVVLDYALTLEPRPLWTMRIGLILLGLVGAGAVLWYLRPDEDVPMDTGDDVLLAIHGASTRLPRGTFLDRSMVLVVGPQGGAKTTLVARSGGAPELIAGLAPTGAHEAPSPTKTVNVWVMQQSIITELGGALLGDVARWSKISRALRAPRMRAALGRGHPAARAAVVCIPVDLFYAGDSGTQLEELGNALRQRLAESSRELGLALPVYVVFTRMDKVPQFEPWISVFTKDELRAPLGATLEFDAAVNPGNYAERLTPRLDAAFRTFAHSLAVRRVNVLGRESVQARRYGAYELPREFGKLIPGVTAFLVELCRPTQLGSSPQLRGFYFTGARPVVVTDVAKAVVPKPASMHTTAEYDEDDRAQRAAAQSGHAVSRKVPEWVFVDRFLRDVVLADASAALMARGGVKIQTARRMLLGAGMVATLLLLTMVTTSWLRNRALSARVELAAHAVSTLPVIPNTPGVITYPSAPALRSLEALRAQLDTIRTYVREGPPLLMRFGLWRGPALYEAARPVWYEGFRTALFATSWSTLVDSLKALPPQPGPANDYSRSYNWLKAYLVTTSEYARSTKEFLSPVLYESGQRGQTLDAEVTALAMRQFDFYSSELPTYNPWPRDPEVPLRTRTRDFLHAFTRGEQIYRNLLTKVDKQVPAVPLRQTPGVFTTMLQVPGSFTSKGAELMLASFNSNTFDAGEIWVVGEYKAQDGISADLLRLRYASDYANMWRKVVTTAVVVKPSTLRDAASKLEAIANNNSPLLELLQVTAVQTNIDSITRVRFQPVHAVTPPDVVGRIVSEKNQPYIDGLLALQGAVAQIANMPNTGDSLSTYELNRAAISAGLQVTQARTAVKRLAQTFVLTSELSMAAPVEQLLLEPINGAERMLRDAASLRPRVVRAVAVAPPPEPPQNPVVAALNDKSSKLCMDMNPILNKYPFSPDSPVEATMADVTEMFRPGNGKFWQFFQESLKPYLEKQGGRWVAKPYRGVTLSAEFVEYFNRGAIVSNALYNDVNPTPQLRWLVKPSVFNEQIPLIVLRHGTKESRFTEKSPTNGVIWPQPPQGTSASLEAQFGKNKPVQIAAGAGEWALFRMVARGLTDANGRHVIVTWPAPAGAKNAQQIVLDFEFLDASGAPVLKKGWLGGFNCASIAAQ